MARTAVDDPQLSVIVPYYDAADTLAAQLEALATQVGAPSFEVLVVDNASPVGPETVVDAWREQLPAVRILRADEAQGVACARNVGIREAVAEKLVFVDADDVAGPTFLAAAARALEDADVVTGNVLSVDAAVFGGGVQAVQRLLPDVPVAAPTVPITDRDYPILMGGACAMTRAAAWRLTGFDQTFCPGSEDNDLALRAVAAGERFVSAPAMTLAERRRASSAGAYRRSFDAGRMHMALCTAHDLWGVSPHLRNPTWWVDAAKLPLAAVAQRRRPASERDWLAYAGRAGLRLGQTVGFVERRVLRRPVTSRLGIGLYPSTDQ